jgi:predicted dehydrogenase
MIRVGVIGTGYIGPIHIEALKRVSGVEVRGVTDPNRELAERTARRYGIEKLYGDYREMLADPGIDAVHTCAPNKLHYAMNTEAIERGKHILSEKPLAMTVAEARDLTERAERKGVVTGIDFCYRYYPAVQEMAARVRRGEAGDIRMTTGTYFQDWLALPTDYSWRLDRAESGESNIAADLGSHWFDLVQFATGLEVTEVMADFATLVPARRKPKRQVLAFEEAKADDAEEVRVELEEYAAVLYRLSNGSPGSFTTSQACIGRKSDTELQVYGSRLSYAWNHRRSTDLWIGHRDRPNEVLIENPSLMDPSVAGFATLPAGHPLGYHDAVANLFKDFYEAVAAGGQAAGGQAGGRGNGARPPRPTFRTGWHEMRILQAVLASRRSRRWVKVEAE